MKTPKPQRVIRMNSKKSLAKTKNTMNAIMDNQHIDNQHLTKKIN